MSHIAKELLLDCSTQEGFHFALHCAECGEAWRSRPVRFSKAGVIPETAGKRVVFERLYQHEKEVALDRAVAEAAGFFNTCPICRRFVCDHCFMICDELDMCQSCAENLKEEGELVLSREQAG